MIISERTNQNILQNGIKYAVDESCLPVKVFCGHVLDLIDKKVDYLFIPRIESVEKRHFVCSKFLGLPDIIRNCIEGSPPILSPNIDFNRRSLYQSMFAAGWKLSKNPIKIHIAYLQAKRKQQDFERMLKLSTSPSEVLELIETGQLNKTDSYADLRVALIGHPYNVYDEFINMGIVKKLERAGVDVLTQEMVPQRASYIGASKVSGDLYWSYGKEILGASLYFAMKRVDGIIFIISFPCGPDSLTVEYTIRQIKGRIPTLSLVIDEHQAEAGIITRLESFIDLVRMRKRK